MALAKIVSKQKDFSYLTEVIGDHFKKGQTKQIVPMEPKSIIRASGLYGLCPRKEVILHLLKPKLDPETLPPGLFLTFEHGHALHDRLQNHILPETGVLYGQWRCMWCSKMHGKYVKGRDLFQTLRRRPPFCSRCGQKEFVYKEIELFDEQLLLSGHPDGFLRFPNYTTLGLLEVKSIGEDDAVNARTAPLMHHVIQAQAYMYMTRTRWARFLYWFKAETGWKALVEHHIDYDEDTVERIKTNILEMRAGMSNGTLPEAICGNQGCVRAQACSVANLCFSRDLVSRVADAMSARMVDGSSVGERID